MEQKVDDSREALAHYFPEGGFEVEPITTGFSHTTLLVKAPSGSSILRIYLHHAPLEKIKQEHELLDQLNAQKGLSFQFPKVIPSVKGETIIKLSSGMHATLFERIPGSSPDFLNLEHWKSMGRATGEVLKAFEGVKVEGPSLATGLEMLYNFFSPCNREEFLEQVKCPAFVQSEGVELILKELDILEKALASMRLPTQVIHGDLHTNNFLVADGKVSGIVDLEISKSAWRVMDVATAITNFGTATDWMSCVDAFAAGFCEEGELTEEELKTLPLVMKTRFVTAFMGTLGWYSREKSEKPLFICSFTLQMATKVISWVNESGEAITQAFATRMKTRKEK